MQTVKIRRVGNSNVVSIPRGLEKLGFAEGTSVAVVPTRTGELILIPADRLDDYIDEVGRRVVERHGAALDKLAAHGRGQGGSAELPPA